MDKEQALENFINSNPTLFKRIEEETDIGALSADNWGKYLAYMQKFPNLYEEEMADIRTFFDIYEGYKNNEKIINLVNTRAGILTEEESYTYSALFPYYSPLATRRNQNVLAGNKITSINQYRMPNLSASINWATNWANSYSPPGFTYLYNIYGNEVDCTNFVSQILYAGAIPLTNQWYFQHTWWGISYSLAWKATPQFASTMGVQGWFAPGHYHNFTANIQVGDVILLDYSNNGSWDHAGFVTHKNNYPASYGNGYYYNHNIAQHSSNYHKWAHENNWPTHNAEAAFGYVRK